MRVIEFFREGFRENKVVVSLLTLLLVAVVTTGLFVLWPEAPDGIKSSDVSVLGTSNTPNSLQIAGGQSTARFTSPVFKSDFGFNAIAPHWKEKNATELNRTLEIRISSDKKEWTQWLEVGPSEAGRDEDPVTDEVFVENPLFIDGQYFQYRTTLSRNALSDPSPRIYDLKVNYIDSRKSKVKRAAEKVASFFKPLVRAEQSINVISREEWGSPDPHGNKFKGKDKYWGPTTVPVEQIFLHHTATSSTQSDPEEVIRGIWDYHANTRGWGDIGYNYLVDQNGTVYEGRFGGDNVVAGHVLRYNTGSLGVGVLGCFEPSSTCNEVNNGNTVAPSEQLLDGLTTLLSWKTTSFEIDPKTQHTFCNYKGNNCLNLWTIAAHRDANNTTCNGQYFYDQLSKIRDDTEAKNLDSFALSAKQLDFSTADLSVEKRIEHTLSFKNMGTSEWSNTTDRLLLKTANPPDRTSDYYNDSWVNESTLATLNEATIAPGETGSFTFDLKRPKDKFGHLNEGFHLVTEGGSEFKNYFNTHIHILCTFGTVDNPRPNGLLIRNANNGKIFQLVNGTKRHIASPNAAKSNRLKLGRAVNVSSSELSVYPTESVLDIAEGSLVKAKNTNAIYIIDNVSGANEKRHIANPKALTTFDLDNVKVYKVSKNKLESYANGPRLFADSQIPDGLLVKSDAENKIYKVEDGQKRWIPHPSFMKSHSYGGKYVRRVSFEKIDELATGPHFNIYRIGTLFTSDNTVKIFAADVTNTGDRQKRWIVSPRAFTNAGFRWNDVMKVPHSKLTKYADSDNVVCHK